jgi:hypothetical protein
MIPLFFPHVSIVARVPRGKHATVKSLCHQAGIECRVTGPTASRRVYLRDANLLAVSREPGYSGRVSIDLPGTDPRERAVLALGVLAYAVFDYAARESVRGWPEMKIAPPRGRPWIPRPKTNAERQRDWRSRKKKCEAEKTQA